MRLHPFIRHLLISIWLGVGLVPIAVLLTFAYATQQVPPGYDVYHSEEVRRAAAIFGGAAFVLMAGFYLIMMSIIGTIIAVINRIRYGVPMPKR